MSLALSRREIEAAEIPRSAGCYWQMSITGIFRNKEIPRGSVLRRRRKFGNTHYQVTGTLK